MNIQSSRIMAGIALAASLSAPSWAQEKKPEDVKSIAARVDAKYKRLATLAADFTERYTGPGIARQESGTLELKRGGRMRWDFTEPRAKLFVSDGKTAYFYVPEDRQVRKAPVKKLDDFHSPIRYLLGRGSLQKEFKDLRIESEKPLQPGNVVLSGVPKHMEEQVERVRFEVSPLDTIERIVIEEVDGSTTDFRFSKLIENGAISDERFRFKPPPGVELIETNELVGP